MAILKGEKLEQDGVEVGASLMAVSARTAPKTRGVDSVKTLVLTGSDLEPLAAAMEKKLEEKKKLLLEKQSRAAVVQAKIARIQTPEQSFKLYASGIFAGLIGVVIVGFFVVLGRDRSIMAAIFSGEFGLQFLTLFSLVIAIILFGILGILEGKELSALLGGLSGYILGRTAAVAKGPKGNGQIIASFDHSGDVEANRPGGK